MAKSKPPARKLPFESCIAPLQPALPADFQRLLDQVRQYAHECLSAATETTPATATPPSPKTAAKPSKFTPAEKRVRRHTWQRNRGDEILRYASNCELAWREQRWSDAITAAYFFGFSQGALISREIDTEPQRRGGIATKEGRLSVWPTILAEADRIYDSYTHKTRPNVICLFHEVMAVAGIPKRGQSSFRSHWSEHRSQKESK